MSQSIITTEFFARNTVSVAKDLLGRTLVARGKGGSLQKAKITETESYLGERDDACHARSGKTLRTKVMYRKPGVMYVYLIYGIHHMLNITTEKKGEPEAVLIRGVEDFDGPGKLTKHLGITKGKHNGRIVGEKSGVWIESAERVADARITKTPRIGIDYANDKWRNMKLRFVLENK